MLKETKLTLFTKDISMYIENPKETVVFNKVIYQGHWIQGQYIKTIFFLFFHVPATNK